MSIKSKFIIVFLSISIIPLLSLGHIHYSNAKNEIEENTKSLLVDEARMINNILGVHNKQVIEDSVSLEKAKSMALNLLRNYQSVEDQSYSRDAQTFIFTKDGQELIGNEQLGPDVVSDLISTATETGDGFSYYNVGDEPYLSYALYDEDWDWTIVVSISLSIMTAITAKIFWITLLSMIGFIILEVFAVFILTDRISKPILALNKSMLQVASGKLAIPSLDTYRNDEIGKINRTHVDMVSSLARLITELKSEIDKSDTEGIGASTTLVEELQGDDTLLKQMSKVRKYAKERIRIAEKIFKNIAEAIVVTDNNGKIQYVNPAFTEVTGYEEEEVYGLTPSILNSGKHSKEFYENLWKSLRENGKWKGEIWNQKKNGEIYPEWLSINSFTDETDKITHFVAIFSDITEQKQHEEMLRLYARIFESSSEGIMITDMNSKIIDVNPAFEETTGYKKHEAIGNRPSMLQSGKHDMPFYIDIWAEIHENGKWHGEIWNKRKNGEVFPEWLTINAVRDEEDNIINYVGIFTDITDRKKAEEKLTHLAHYDVLTKLPNRHLFHQRLNKALSEALVNDKKVALLFLDLDRFKMINDTLGHSVGDQLLFEVATRLKKCIREGDTVSRLGGDEFTVILKSINDLNDIITVINRIFSSLGTTFDINGHEMFVSTSIGISIYPDDAEDREELVKNADTAMYRAKEDKGNNYVFFNMDMNKSLSDKMRLENALRKAINKNEFELYYQPQIDVQTKQVAGAEALIRWTHPELGRVSPGEFIPVAEDTGMIIPIGEWVLKEACYQIKDWIEKYNHPIKMSVNISAHQFKNNNLINMIKHTLEETQIPPEYLNLEITETVSMYDYDFIISVLTSIKEMGVNLSIDDFGKGHSSLSYLKEFPVNYLKIDRCFIRNLGTDIDNQAIVKSVITMAQGLDMLVVAEGVEEQEEVTILEKFNCDYIQGYFYGKPVTAEDFETDFLN